MEIFLCLISLNGLFLRPKFTGRNKIPLKIQSNTLKTTIFLKVLASGHGYVSIEV